MFQPEEHDRPRPEDFLPPYFFLSTRDLAKVSYVTQSMYGVLGYDPVKVLGRPCSDFLIPDDPLNADFSETSRRQLSHGEFTDVLRAVYDVNGGRRVLHVQTTGMRDPQQDRMICKHSIARDVTDDIGIAQSVLQRIHQLTERLGSLSQRDQQIAEAATQGKTNETVARDLDISIRTVERRRKALRDQFAVDHVAEIVALVAELKSLKRIWESQPRQPWRYAENVTAISYAQRALMR